MADTRPQGRDEDAVEARVTTFDYPEAVATVLVALAEHKAEQIAVLDMREVSGFTDYMVLANGRSQPHVRALVDAVEEQLAATGAKPSHVEGRAESNWVLIDYFDVVVHVFVPETRDFYQLERLWRDAPLLEWSDEATDPSEPEGGSDGDSDDA